jgi:phosphoglycerate dehydrogenase-like enzyme
VKLAVLDDYQRVAESMADWKGALPEVDVTFFGDHVDDEDALVERLTPFEAVFAMRERTALPRSVFERLPNLRLVVSPGMWNAAIDVQAASDHGVLVCGTNGSAVATSWATAELTWALILATARHIPMEDASVRAGGWQETVGVDVAAKTLGLVGLGRLGGRVARVAKAFDMDVVAWSPNLTAERAGEHGARLVAKDELFRVADVISVHMVLGSTTRGLIGETELRSMKPTAIFVNTSRGPIVEEAALVRALQEGWIAGAGIDVFDKEPLPLDHPLRSAPRCVLTPHLGYVTVDTYRAFFGLAIDDIRGFLDGSPVRVIEPGAGPKPTR